MEGSELTPSADPLYRARIHAWVILRTPSVRPGAFRAAGIVAVQFSCAQRGGARPHRSFDVRPVASSSRRSRMRF